MRRTTAAAVLILVMLTVGACGKDDPAPTGAATTTAAAQATPAAAETITAAAPAAEAPKTPAAAGDIVKKLEAAGLGLTRVAVQDEDTDPNDLLGRPNQYTSRASADLPGGDKDASKYDIDRGLVAEGFADAAGAKRRSDYIQGLQKDSPMLGTEWHYLTKDGLTLVRVSGKVKPSLAKKVEHAVAAL